MVRKYTYIQGKLDDIKTFLRKKEILSVSKDFYLYNIVYLSYPNRLLQ